MGRIQRYHQKLWLAGEAGNTELAKFYLHEMEEAMEEIAEGHVVEDSVDVSANMRTYGLATVELVEKAGTQGVELLMWLATRGALGAAVRERHRGYHIPISNTASGLMLLEPAA